MKLCKICDQPVKKGATIYCSRKCANSDPDKKETTRRNNIARYGVSSPNELDEVNCY